MTYWNRILPNYSVWLCWWIDSLIAMSSTARRPAHNHTDTHNRTHTKACRSCCASAFQFRIVSVSPLNELCRVVLINYCSHRALRSENIYTHIYVYVVRLAMTWWQNMAPYVRRAHFSRLYDFFYCLRAHISTTIRLVFRPYTQVWRSICTSESLPSTKNSWRKTDTICKNRFETDLL